MTLQEFLDTTTEEILFIGSGSGFFFVGTKEEFYNLEHRLDIIAKEDIRRRLTTAQGMVKGYKEKAERCTQDYDKRIWLGRMELNLKKLRSTQKELRCYSPIRTRKVTDQYRKCLRDGYVVIVEGSEHGRYWSRNEFLKDYPIK